MPIDDVQIKAKGDTFLYKIAAVLLVLHVVRGPRESDVRQMLYMKNERRTRFFSSSSSPSISFIFYKNIC